MKYSRTADKLCELGRATVKTGAGWFDHSRASAMHPESELVNKMIEDFTARTRHHAAQHKRRGDGWPGLCPGQ